MRIAKRFALALALGFLLPLAAQAAELATYNAEAFAKAQADGRTILVDVHADWCSTCAVQKPIIHKVAKEPTFSKAILFVVDFDSTPRFLRAHRVAHQSTLIAFKGTKEVGRSVADVREPSIRALWAKAL